MKWPNTVTLVRHAESAYNAAKRAKERNPLYQQFKKAFGEDPTSIKTKEIAEEVLKKFALGVSDSETPLTKRGWLQGVRTGELIGTIIPKPDVILCSPYLRTRSTLSGIGRGWKINVKKAIMERRLREQEHGLSLLYNDSRILQVLFPEQKLLKDLLGPYWYQYPQGESMPQVQDRVQSITDTLIREYSGMNVLIITHHKTILALRGNLERLPPKKIIMIDDKEKPVNCGVTLYRGNPNRGKNGKLELDFYNKCLH